jgi:hypothetical protein
VFTRPQDLSDDEVAAAVGAGWRLEVTGIQHAPVGYGSHHWRVDDGAGRSWFVTADDLRTRRRDASEPLGGPLGRLRAALSTAACLQGEGVAWVVAPVPSASGEVVTLLGDAYALAVYPLVEGRTFGWGPFDDDRHRREVLERIVDLHTHAGCRGLARVDALTVPLTDQLMATVADPGPKWDAGPFAGAAWELLVERGDAVTGLIDRHARLATRADPRRFVLTHGEPHRANTVVTDSGTLLVDWDTVLLAPAERDVWRMVAEEPAVATVYEQRTGTTLDDHLLEAYRLGWELADVASFVPVLRAPHDDDADARTAWAGLEGVLANPSAG